MRKLLVLFPVAAILALSSCGQSNQKPTEPAWDGTPLSTWIKQLKSENAVERGVAAHALGEIGPAAKAAVPFLIEALKDSDWNVRSTAAGALGRIGPEAKPAVSALVQLVLLDKDPGVRFRAQEAMGGIGAAAVPTLRETFKDAGSHERIAVVWCLKHVGKPGMPILIDALKDQDEEVRSQAALILEHVGPDAKEAVHALLEARKENSVVRVLAENALKKIDPDEATKAGIK